MVPLTMSSLKEKLHLQSYFLKILRELATKRHERIDFVHDHTGKQESSWIVYERESLWSRVNIERSNRGIQHITLKDFIRKENQAVGHSDYSNKLALYCAEFSLGEI